MVRKGQILNTRDICSFIRPQRSTSEDTLFCHNADQLVILIIYAFIITYWKFVSFVQVCDGKQRTNFEGLLVSCCSED